MNDSYKTRNMKHWDYFLEELKNKKKLENMIDYRRTKILHKISCTMDIRKIADTYHKWQKEDESYEDIKGFCKSVSIEEVREAVKRGNFIVRCP